MKKIIKHLSRIIGYFFNKYLLKINPVIFISILLAIIPFFWLKPGEMDLGGDSGRLYFYDPVNQIKNLELYYISPFGIGLAEPNFAYIPFIGILVIIKQIIGSSYVLISLHNALKLVVGFVAIYAIVKELIGKGNNKNSFGMELVSILAGLFYLSTPAMIGNYAKAISTHDQVFLNPLMFYLFLRFFLTGKMRYMWVFFVVSFIFANNFSYLGAPPFFAFYPSALFFIFLYSIFIRHVKPPWRKLLLVLLLFLGLHAFYLIPEIFDIFSPGSNTNVRLSASDIPRYIDYFYGVLNIPKISFHLLAYSSIKELAWVSIVIPFIVLFGLILNRKREKTILLAAVFFLLTFFLATGKLTNVGVKFYETLFYIPGFSMFRNFYGQWQFSFYFFYSLLFGLAIYSILQKVRFEIFSKALFLVLVAYFAISSWQFINGSLVNPFREGAKNVKAAIIMDPKYEDTMSFIRSLQDDGKILILPFTDSYMQVIHGLNDDGAYVGISTIGPLTSKKDFAGYVRMSPYSEIFWQLSKERDYESIKRLLGLLNIRYIFYNSDTRIYDTTFPGSPYSPNYVRKYMPPSQAEYGEYIKNIASEKIYERGFYSIYKIDEKSFLPHFYIPEEIVTSAFLKEDIAKRPVYIETQACKAIFSENLCNQKTISMENNLPRIQFEKINPTKYRVKVFNATKPYILVFLEAFHKSWKVYISSKEPKEEDFVSSYFDGKIQEGRHKDIFIDEKTFETLGMRSLPENTHFIGNGYANAWLITPFDVQGKSDYEFIIEMTGQRIFYIGLGISILTLLGCLLWSIGFFFFKRLGLV